ncbi:titin homolog [Leptopilina boulardi]|uniref:titin homolog n=1 Tax=Leptopilina boulardi TaxID=63433 RepID=UPI0021F56B2B|nr:titin homolog [Leptopilina boulardi]
MATSTEDLNIPEGFLVAPRVPQGLAAAVEGLTREVIRQRPEDIYVFAAHHFEKLLHLREAYGVTRSLSVDERNIQALRDMSEALRKRDAFREERNSRDFAYQSGWSLNETAKVLERHRSIFGEEGQKITTDEVRQLASEKEREKVEHYRRHRSLEKRTTRKKDEGNVRNGLKLISQIPTLPGSTVKDIKSELRKNRISSQERRTFLEKTESESLKSSGRTLERREMEEEGRRRRLERKSKGLSMDRVKDYVVKKFSTTRSLEELQSPTYVEKVQEVIDETAPIIKGRVEELKNSMNSKRIRSLESERSSSDKSRSKESSGKSGSEESENRFRSKKSRDEKSKEKKNREERISRSRIKEQKLKSLKSSKASEVEPNDSLEDVETLKSEVESIGSKNGLEMRLNETQTLLEGISSAFTAPMRRSSSAKDLRNRMSEGSDVSFPVVRPLSSKAHSRSVSRSDSANFVLPPISPDAPKSTKIKEDLILPVLSRPGSSSVEKEADVRIKEEISEEKIVGEENISDTSGKYEEIVDNKNYSVDNVDDSLPMSPKELKIIDTEIEEVFRDSLNVTPEPSETPSRPDSLEPEVQKEDQQSDLKEQLLEIETVEKNIQSLLDPKDNLSQDEISIRRKLQELENSELRINDILQETEKLESVAEKLKTLEEVEKRIDSFLDEPGNFRKEEDSGGAIIGEEELVDGNSESEGKEKKHNTEEEESEVKKEKDEVEEEETEQEEDNANSDKEDKFYKEEVEGNFIPSIPYSFVLTEGSPCEIPDSVTTVIIPDRISTPDSDILEVEVEDGEVRSRMTPNTNKIEDQDDELSNKPEASDLYVFGEIIEPEPKSSLHDIDLITKTGYDIMIPHQDLDQIKEEDDKDLDRIKEEDSEAVRIKSGRETELQQIVEEVQDKIEEEVKNNVEQIEEEVKIEKDDDVLKSVDETENKVKGDVEDKEQEDQDKTKDVKGNESEDIDEEELKVLQLMTSSLKEIQESENGEILQENENKNQDLFEDLSTEVQRIADSESTDETKETSITDGIQETTDVVENSLEIEESTGRSIESTNEVKETTMTDQSNTSLSLDPGIPIVPELNLDSLQDITVSSFKLTDEEIEKKENEETESIVSTTEPEISINNEKIEEEEKEEEDYLKGSEVDKVKPEEVEENVEKARVSKLESEGIKGEDIGENDNKGNENGGVDIAKAKEEEEVINSEELKKVEEVINSDSFEKQKVIEEMVKEQVEVKEDLCVKATSYVTTSGGEDEAEENNKDTAEEENETEDTFNKKSILDEETKDQVQKEERKNDVNQEEGKIKVDDVTKEMDTKEEISLQDELKEESKENDKASVEGDRKEEIEANETEIVKDENEININEEKNIAVEVEKENEIEEGKEASVKEEKDASAEEGRVFIEEEKEATVEDVTEVKPESEKETEIEEKEETLAKEKENTIEKEVEEETETEIEKQEEATAKEENETTIQEVTEAKLEEETETEIKNQEEATAKEEKETSIQEVTEAKLEEETETEIKNQEEATAKEENETTIQEFTEAKLEEEIETEKLEEVKTKKEKETTIEEDTESKFKEETETEIVKQEEDIAKEEKETTIEKVTEATNKEETETETKKQEEAINEKEATIEEDTEAKLKEEIDTETERKEESKIENKEETAANEEKETTIQEDTEVKDNEENEIKVTEKEAAVEEENKFEAEQSIKIDNEKNIETQIEKESEIPQTDANEKEESIELIESRSASQCTTRRINSANNSPTKEEHFSNSEEINKIEKNNDNENETQINEKNNDFEIQETIKADIVTNAIDDDNLDEKKEYHIYVPDLNDSENSISDSSSFISAATKIQAGIRGFLIRRRLQNSQFRSSTLDSVPSIQESFVVDPGTTITESLLSPIEEVTLKSFDDNTRQSTNRKRLRREDAIQRPTLSLENAFAEGGLQHTGEFHDCIPLPVFQFENRRHRGKKLPGSARGGREKLRDKEKEDDEGGKGPKGRGKEAESGKGGQKEAKEPKENQQKGKEEEIVKETTIRMREDKRKENVIKENDVINDGIELKSLGKEEEKDEKLREIQDEAKYESIICNGIRQNSRSTKILENGVDKFSLGKKKFEGERRRETIGEVRKETSGARREKEGNKDREIKNESTKRNGGQIQSMELETNSGRRKANSERREFGKEKDERKEVKRYLKRETHREREVETKNNSGKIKENGAAKCNGIEKNSGRSQFSMRREKDKDRNSNQIIEIERKEENSKKEGQISREKINGVEKASQTINTNQLVNGGEEQLSSGERIFNGIGKEKETISGRKEIINETKMEEKFSKSGENIDEPKYPIDEPKENLAEESHCYFQHDLNYFCHQGIYPIPNGFTHSPPHVENIFPKESSFNLDFNPKLGPILDILFAKEDPMLENNYLNFITSVEDNSPEDVSQVPLEKIEVNLKNNSHESIREPLAIPGSPKRIIIEDVTSLEETSSIFIEEYKIVTNSSLTSKEEEEEFIFLEESLKEGRDQVMNQEELEGIEEHEGEGEIKDVEKEKMETFKEAKDMEKVQEVNVIKEKKIIDFCQRSSTFFEEVTDVKISKTVEKLSKNKIHENGKGNQEEMKSSTNNDDNPHLKTFYSFERKKELSSSISDKLIPSAKNLNKELSSSDDPNPSSLRDDYPNFEDSSLLPDASLSTLSFSMNIDDVLGLGSEDESCKEFRIPPSLTKFNSTDDLGSSRDSKNSQHCMETVQSPITMMQMESKSSEEKSEGRDESFSGVSKRQSGINDRESSKGRGEKLTKKFVRNENGRSNGNCVNVKERKSLEMKEKASPRGNETDSSSGKCIEKKKLKGK